MDRPEAARFRRTTPVQATSVQIQPGGQSMALHFRIESNVHLELTTDLELARRFADSVLSESEKNAPSDFVN